MKIRSISLNEIVSYNKFMLYMAKTTDYLLLLPKEAGSITPEEKKKNIEYMQKNNFGDVIVALDNDEIIGAIWFCRPKLDKVKHSCRFGIGILESYQQQGIGSKLLKSAEEWFVKNNIKRVAIEVIDGNPALGFYKKHGYKEEGVLKKAIFMNDKYYDEIVMAKIFS